MKYISIFESLTGAKVKDCIVNDGLTFIMHEDEMGKAIGKQGSNIKRIENILKKKIKLIEFSNNILKFIGNLIHPLKAKDIKEEDGITTIYVEGIKTKGMLIGRDRHRINTINNIVKRYFLIAELGCFASSCTFSKTIPFA